MKLQMVVLLIGVKKKVETLYATSLPIFYN